MAEVELRHVYKEYDEAGEFAVTNFNLEIEDGEFIVFVGPSGCGKSTTLRMIAGLEDITAGELFIGDRKVNDVAPKDRDIAMVFQSYALYPHMTVYDNMAFGLELQKVDKDEIEKRVTEVATTLGIEDLLDRLPAALSGGQRQRVALGRATVREPVLFLMDEPLSNLDAKLRVKMRSEMSKLHEELDTTIIYVTHDQTEAMTLADRVVIMDQGFVQQVGSPMEVYDRPDNTFVATFMGSPAMNLMDAYYENGTVRTKFGLELPVTEPQRKMLDDRGYDGQELVFGIRPEDILAEQISLDTMTDSVRTMKINLSELLGAESILYLDAGNGVEDELIAVVDSRDYHEDGSDVDLAFNMNKAHYFDKETNQVIRLDKVTTHA